MKEPLVSVVMPTYNHAQFIKEAIDSVRGQTYLNWELIIIDNYSEDNTREIIEAYGDDRIRYVQFRNNGIIAASRNRGIEQAKGEYVAFIDSDDVWLPEKLSWQVRAMEPDRRRGISFGKFRVTSPDKIETGRLLGPKSPTVPFDLYPRLIKANFIVSSSTLVLKKALDEVGHFDEDPELRCSEDFDLWLRILRKYRPAYVNEVMGLYRMHGSNQSADDLRLSRAMAVIDKHWKNGWITEFMAEQAKASFYAQVAVTLVDVEPKKARQYFRETQKLAAHNIKLHVVACAGTVLTWMPAVYRALRRSKIDRAVTGRTINAQNL